MIFNMYIFARSGSCLFSKEWHRPLNTLASDDSGEDARLMFGFLFSLKEIMGKMSAKVPTGREDIQVMRTSSYSTHVYETQTGLRFVLNVDAHAASLRPELEQIYASIFVEQVIKNPLYTPGAGPLEIPEEFEEELEAYLRALPVAQPGF